MTDGKARGTTNEVTVTSGVGGWEDNLDPVCYLNQNQSFHLVNICEGDTYTITFCLINKTFGPSKKGSQYSTRQK